MLARRKDSSKTDSNKPISPRSHIEISENLAACLDSGKTDQLLTSSMILSNLKQAHIKNQTILTTEDQDKVSPDLIAYDSSENKSPTSETNISKTAKQITSPNEHVSVDISKISTCSDLNHALHDTDEQVHDQLLKALGNKLYEIVNDLFDMRDISEEYHLPIYQRLGYGYVSSLIHRSYQLIDVTSKLPEQDRLPFLKIVGLDKVRSYIHGDERVDDLLSIMPPYTHEELKNALFIYSITLYENGKSAKLARIDNELSDIDLSNSKTEYAKIVNPIAITDTIVIGRAFLKDMPGSPSKLISYNTLLDVVSDVINYDFHFIRLIDSKNQIFLAMSRKPIAYQISCINGKLLHTNTSHTQQHNSKDPDDSEHISDILTLPDGKLLVLSREVNNVINIYKGWYIDVFDPVTFTLTRKLNVHRDQYDFMNHFSLMPDGKTVLAWADCTVKAETANCCKQSYSICLINTEDYTLQRLILPIDPRRVQGEIAQVNVVGDEIEIEISVSSPNYFTPKSYLYYSFEFQDLRLKNYNAQLDKEHEGIRFNRN